jgi:two-component system phosphate regulon response regulator PhoB
MVRVLIAEDDTAMASLLQEHLERGGYETEVASDGLEALCRCDSFAPDLVVLDWMLPSLSGIEVCRMLRERATGSPIVLMLTARDGEEDALAAFDAGIDDYVRKPFGVRELLQRVQALVRLSGRSTGDASALMQAGPLTLDARARTVHVGAQPVRLTPMEFDLLRHFVRHPGVVLQRDALLASLWGYAHQGYARTVDTHVTRLRRKLAQAGLPGEVISTVPRLGYRFELAQAEP